MISQASGLLGIEQKNKQEAKASWLAKYAEQSNTNPNKYVITYTC